MDRYCRPEQLRADSVRLSYLIPRKRTSAGGFISIFSAGLRLGSLDSVRSGAQTTTRADIYVFRFPFCALATHLIEHFGMLPPRGKRPAHASDRHQRLMEICAKTAQNIFPNGPEFPLRHHGQADARRSSLPDCPPLSGISAASCQDWLLSRGSRPAGPRYFRACAQSRRVLATDIIVPQLETLDPH